MAQTVDAVAHHEAHRAGIEIRPDRLCTVARFGFQEFFRNDVERVVPADRLERALALRALSAQRLRQAVRMMDAIRIARDLGADYARGIGVLLGATHAPDPRAVMHLDFQRAGRGTIVRTGRGADRERSRVMDVHPASV
jgi:hypothetical protein